MRRRAARWSPKPIRNGRSTASTTRWAASGRCRQKDVPPGPIRQGRWSTGSRPASVCGAKRTSKEQDERSNRERQGCPPVRTRCPRLPRSRCRVDRLVEGDHDPLERFTHRLLGSTPTSWGTRSACEMVTRSNALTYEVRIAAAFDPRNQAQAVRRSRRPVVRRRELAGRRADRVDSSAFQEHAHQVVQGTLVAHASVTCSAVGHVDFEKSGA